MDDVSFISTGGQGYTKKKHRPQQLTSLYGHKMIEAVRHKYLYFCLFLNNFSQFFAFFIVKIFHLLKSSS